MNLNNQKTKFLKLIKNIKETSVNEQDRVNRLIELEDKFDIPKTHLL